MQAVATTQPTPINAINVNLRGRGNGTESTQSAERVATSGNQNNNAYLFRTTAIATKTHAGATKHAVPGDARKNINQTAVRIVR